MFNDWLILNLFNNATWTAEATYHHKILEDNER
jgi:hypothetical protein